MESKVAIYFQNNKGLAVVQERSAVQENVDRGDISVGAWIIQERWHSWQKD